MFATHRCRDSDYNDFLLFFFLSKKMTCFSPSLTLGERRGDRKGQRGVSGEGRERAMLGGCGFGFQFVLSFPVLLSFLFHFCFMF